MPINVELIPTIPDGIREAATRGVLVPFVGAGASLLAGCPSWSQFAGRALKALLSSGSFSYAQLAQLEHLSPRVKISIALGMQKDANRTLDFKDLLSPTGGYENLMGRRVYGALSGIAQTFVTTNYDEWLDNEIAASQTVTSKASKASAVPPPSRARKVYHKIDDLTPDKLSEPGVFHIHGSLLDPAGMIMTTSDYLRHYANDHHDTRPNRENRLLTFLEHLFQHKTVLFVGYGLEELEILEYVVQKARRSDTRGVHVAKHYILQGYFGHEVELMQSMRSYYLNECGIELIGFRRDEKDWEQLADVLEYFANNLTARDPMLAQDFSEMEGFLDG